MHFKGSQVLYCRLARLLGCLTSHPAGNGRQPGLFAWRCIGEGSSVTCSISATLQGDHKWLESSLLGLQVTGPSLQDKLIHLISIKQP